MAIPPDGGFGWVVLVLSFLSQLIVDGIVFSIGILLPAMEKDFQVHTSEVALLASIQIGCYFMGGAFSSALINSYGFRPVAMLGVVISALALTAASFSPNLTVMIIVYSVIGRYREWFYGLTPNYKDRSRRRWTRTEHDMGELAAHHWLLL